MDEKMFSKKSLYITGIVTAGIWSLLLWDHFNGGVPSHHIMHQKDLPAISNWWGGLLLPSGEHGHLDHRGQAHLSYLRGPGRIRTEPDPGEDPGGLGSCQGPRKVRGPARTAGQRPETCRHPGIRGERPRRETDVCGLRDFATNFL